MLVYFYLLILLKSVTSVSEQVNLFKAWNSLMGNWHEKHNF